MNANENEWVDFVVTARKYKTLLTKKYKERPVWHKPEAGDILSHLPGTILEIEVKAGQHVETGDLLLIQESMKMNNRIVAPFSGTVEEICVHPGDKIAKNVLLMKVSS